MPMTRLFLAIPIDENCQQQMDAQVAARQTRDDALRWTARSNRHLTLVFLGDVTAPQQQQLLANGHHLPRPVPFEIVFDVWQRFPDARGNVLALTPSVENAPLMALQQEVARWVESCGVVNPEKNRPFRPHITLARIRSPAHFVWPGALKGAQPRGSDPSCVLRVERVQLYSSEQIEGKRVYRPLLPLG